MNKQFLGAIALALAVSAVVPQGLRKWNGTQKASNTIYWYRCSYPTILCIPVVTDFENVYVGDYWSDIAGCENETLECCAVGYEEQNINPVTKKPYYNYSWSLVKYKSE